jgi:hypothetical protein
MPFDSLPLDKAPVDTGYDVPGQILIKARALIAKHGWCQFALSNDMRLCAVGAINVAADARIGFSEAVLRLAEVLPYKLRNDDRAKERAPDRVRLAQIEVIYWNDTKSRRKAQVLAKFDRAIANSRVSAS